ncbi:MAG: NUDIX domain-containing protein [Granulosicoccus sp.]
MQEWLDIVDLDDVVVGRETRDKVHQLKLLHRSSHIVLFNSSGQVFVQLRSLKKDEGPGLWDSSAAGHVDSGETYLQCAVRELQEELGIRVEPEELQHVSKLAADERNGFEFTQIFTVFSDQPLVLQEEEIDDGRWLPPDELDLWLESAEGEFTGIFRLIWSVVRSPHQKNVSGVAEV